MDQEERKRRREKIRERIRAVSASGKEPDILPQPDCKDAEYAEILRLAAELAQKEYEWKVKHQAELHAEAQMRMRKLNQKYRKQKSCMTGGPERQE